MELSKHSIGAGEVHRNLRNAETAAILEIIRDLLESRRNPHAAMPWYRKGYKFPHSDTWMVALAEGRKLTISMEDLGDEPTIQ